MLFDIPPLGSFLFWFSPNSPSYMELFHRALLGRKLRNPGLSSLPVKWGCSILTMNIAFKRVLWVTGCRILKWKAQANIWKESWASRSLCWPWFECILVRPREAMLPLISMESEAWPVRITSWLLNLCASCLASLFCVLKVRIDNSFIRLLVSFEWVKRLECLE